MFEEKICRDKENICRDFTKCVQLLSGPTLENVRYQEMFQRLGQNFNFIYLTIDIFYFAIFCAFFSKLNFSRVGLNWIQTHFVRLPQYTLKHLEFHKERDFVIQV